MRVVLLALAILAAAPSSLAAPCAVSSHEERPLPAGMLVASGHSWCDEDVSGRRHASATLVTSEGNVSASFAHVRTGDRDGAHGVAEQARVVVLKSNATLDYASARDAAGYTTCRARLVAWSPLGRMETGDAVAACAPQELLLP